MSIYSQNVKVTKTTNTKGKTDSRLYFAKDGEDKFRFVLEGTEIGLFKADFYKIVNTLLESKSSE